MCSMTIRSVLMTPLSLHEHTDSAGTRLQSAAQIIRRHNTRMRLGRISAQGVNARHGQQ